MKMLRILLGVSIFWFISSFFRIALWLGSWIARTGASFSSSSTVSWVRSGAANREGEV